MKRFLALALTLGLPLSALGAEPVRVQVLSATVKDQAISGAQVSEQVGGLLQRLRGEQLKSAPAVTRAQLSLADALNKKGEAAYHAKKLDEAVSLYLEAIANNPEHGQAYSNLGLAYQKLNRSAEALWANRKAIALASGPNADTVKASSYFNIARVYENDGLWAEALDSYQSALGHKDHPAYRGGIEKMKQKLGQN